MQLNLNTCTAQELADAARAGYAMHSENPTKGIGVTLLGRGSGVSAGTYHIFELSADVETKLDAANTSPERLLAHAQGFLVNRAHAQGEAAYFAGEDRDANPYTALDSRIAWAEGWDEGKAW